MHIKTGIGIGCKNQVTVSLCYIYSFTLLHKRQVKYESTAKHFPAPVVTILDLQFKSNQKSLDPASLNKCKNRKLFSGPQTVGVKNMHKQGENEAGTGGRRDEE